MLTICTLAEVKSILGIGDADDDAGLTLWMEGLAARVDRFCQRTLLRGADVAEMHDGGYRSIYLKRFPVESVSAVYISDDETWDATTLVSSDGYKLVADRGRLLYGKTGVSYWPAGVANVRVVYTGGYLAVGTTPTGSQQAMPDDIRRAMLMQANFEWRNLDSLGVTQISAGGAARQMTPSVLMQLAGRTLQPEVESTLAPYVRRIHG